ncbi:hypothetical protein PENTCL1PPCAC_9423, partial [Pristionchus entomophagus]|uniref:RING-type domain-containing protein n=1 Tax=Pristionchus entomophagus TaxID=358040 RepID=A0AAV5SWV0_9BILA
MTANLSKEIIENMNMISDGRLPYPPSSDDLARDWELLDTPKQIERIERMREAEAQANPAVYSRRCAFCEHENPQRRAVLVEFGHAICMACALKRVLIRTPMVCPCCFVITDFVRMFEKDDQINCEIMEIDQADEANDLGIEDITEEEM